MILTYLGHSAFYVEDSNFRALIDPFLSQNPQYKTDINDFKNITHIFVTHGHSDHIGDTVRIAQRDNSLVICNYELGLYFSSKDLRVHSMHIGGRTRFEFGVVKMTQAVHGSSIKTEKGLECGGNPGGFVISINDKKLYHAGDTGLTMDMMLLENEKIDVALLPVGGNFTMDVEDAARAVEFIKPKMVIPMHYNTFKVIETDLNQFNKLVKGAEVKVLNYKDSFEI